MATERSLDLVLLGATGYTGGLVAEYLARHAPKDLRWAIAGRDAARLRALVTRLGACGQPKPDIVHADLTDGPGLSRLAASTRAMLSTAGPYLRVGEPLVHACAQAGTHYADICGESEFVDRMWLGYHELARDRGARIVPACGFEAAAADLGAWYTARLLPDGPKRVEGYVFVDATFSRGTPLHSVVTSLSRACQRRDAHRARLALERPASQRRGGATRQRPHFNRSIGAWALPFPSIDAQVVRRTAAALAEYGCDFRYGHYLQLDSAGALVGAMAGAAGLVAASRIGVTRRWLLSLRPPGDGPTAAQRAAGRFRITFLGEGGGQRVRTHVSGGDPGYGETAKLLAESGLCLALDPLPPVAGVLTPVQAMGQALLTRAQRADIQFEQSPASCAVPIH
jgi:short subunit dehydrogenase-like uncharacterized protein